VSFEAAWAIRCLALPMKYKQALLFLLSQQLSTNEIKISKMKNFLAHMLIAKSRGLGSPLREWHKISTTPSFNVRRWHNQHRHVFRMFSLLFVLFSRCHVFRKQTTRCPTRQFVADVA
jgi:hypothetical protein